MPNFHEFYKMGTIVKNNSVLTGKVIECLKIWDATYIDLAFPVDFESISISAKRDVSWQT